MTPLRVATAETFASLQIRNFRLFFIGQGVSQIGTWAQSVGLVWLVLDRTDSGVALGLVTALQFLPVLLFAPLAGVAADRFDKRRLMMATQAAATLQAIVLAVVALAGVGGVGVVYGLTAVFGLITALDNPVRRAFVPELVDDDHVTNAIGLNSALMTGSRIVGPALAGLLIAGAGVGWCFVANAVSYLAVLVGLTRMEPAVRPGGRLTGSQRGAVRAGLRYAWATPELRYPLILVAVTGTFALNFPVLLPLLSERTLHGGASTFGLLYSTMSVGSLVGALLVARMGRVRTRFLAWASVAFGVSMGLLAAAPGLGLALAATLPVGASSVLLVSAANSKVQLAAVPEMRGRVNAVFAMVLLGSTPIGGPIAGWVAEHFGARAGLGLGAVGTVLTGLAVLGSASRAGTTRAADRVVPRAA